MLRKRKADILIVSTSARALMESAVRAGRVPAAIDAFGDWETRRHGAFCAQVPLTAAGGFEPRALREAFARCLERFGRSLEGWVAASGFEACGELLHDLSRRLPLIANDPRVFDLCARRGELKDRAARLGLPCVPESAGTVCLSKRDGAHGGAHIQLHAAPAPHTVRETYLPGVAVSHVFLAARGQIVTVGLGTQWHSAHDRARPFAYGGAINRCALAEAGRLQVEEWSRRLSADLELRGLNNVDYLWSAGRIYFLELNPRASGSFALYDPDFPGGLLNAHIDSCRARIPHRAAASLPRAQAVIYAHRDFTLAEDFDWDGTSDRPSARSFTAGEPVCSLSAQCGTAGQTLSSLQASIRNLLERIRGGIISREFVVHPSPVKNSACSVTGRARQTAINVYESGTH